MKTDQEALSIRFNSLFHVAMDNLVLKIEISVWYFIAFIKQIS
jgi:hypothetical protein